MKLTCPVASILSDFAMAKAESIGVPVVIAFTNDHAELVYFGKMAGALPASGEIAIKKAQTSAALRLSTAVVGQMAQPGKELYGIQHIISGGAVLFGGGLPLLYEQKIIGGVGISGGTVKEDVAVAETVRNKLDQMIRLHGQLAPLLIGRLKSLTTARRFNRLLVSALGQIDDDSVAGWSDIIAGAVLLTIEK